jgi:hypothetical protein
MARTVATKQSQSKEREQNSKERSRQPEQQPDPYSKIFSLQRMVGNRAVEQILGKGTVLQRKCACGGSAGLTGECSECENKTLTLQRRTSDRSETDQVPPIAHEVLSLPRIPMMQAKLTIGESDHPLEREADRIAEQVLAAPVHSVASSAPVHIQRFTRQASGQADMVAPASVDRVLASPGSPLEPALQQDMEQRFGYDFSQVRVHTDAAAERSAQDVNANAYTVGHNIVFGAGRFSPGTHEGRRLLAHELTHVVQQTGFNRTHMSQSNENPSWLPISTSHGRIQLQRFLSSEPAGGCGVCYGIPANAGKAAHTLIQTEFEILYPLGLVELGVSSADDDNGRLDLAIAVPGGFEIGEIKPANAKGYEDGITQIAKYIGLISTKFPSATIKPLTKLLPSVIFPTLSSDCPVQVLAVNPPVGGVYGYFCKPSFAQLKRKGCSCPTPRKMQEEEKKEKKEKKEEKKENTDPKAVPQRDAKRFEQQILDFIHEVIVGGQEVEEAVRKFLNDHPEIVRNIELIIAGIAAGAILTDILSAGTATAKDPLIAAILSAMFRIARAMRAVLPALGGAF